MSNFEFDFIGLTESKIKDVNPSFDIKIDGYTSFFTPTEAEKGGAMLYVKNHFNTKRRSDLENILYKSRDLESVFIEICNKGKTNIILGCIYKHPSLDLEEFNENFLTPMLKKLENEHKKIFLLGDFNINLLHVD